jgi:aminopeptidase N
MLRRALVCSALVACVTAGCTGSPQSSAPRASSPEPGPSTPASSGAGALPRTDPAALARIERVPTPRPAPATAASVGDPLFPGLGNGGYDVQRYDLALTYPRTDPRQTVRGAVTVTARATRALPLLNLDFSGGGVTAVSVDGQRAAFRRRGSELEITPASPVAAGRTFVVVVDGFTATPIRVTPKTQGRAALLHTSDGTSLAGQPAAMHTLFPCNDHPSDKAAFTFTLDAPRGWTAVASGDLAGTTTRANRTTWRYRHDAPMATELVQVVVGAYDVVERPAVGGVRLRDVLPRSLSPAERAALTRQGDQVAWLTARLGPYPFGVYGRTVAAADFSASETQTLIIMPRALLAEPSGRLDQVLLHELSHQWFGDSVTPAQWSDAWLNEGHATWYELLYGQEKGTLRPDWPGDDLDTVMKDVYGASNRLRTRFGPPAAPRSAREPQDLFNPNIYVGGALALYALRQEVGVPAFEEIERRWVREHRDGVASTADFVTLASQVAGRDLEPLLGAWLYGKTTPPMPGHPDWQAG